jgi:type I restriction enzyme R subunit
LKTEEDLWRNFKSILENNNQDVLEGVPLSDTEFLRVKNQVVSSSFYDAGVKLNGENGQFHVQITRENKNVTLTVFNRYHKTGGSTVYQIVDQFSSFASNEGYQDRRFDMSFLFNGIPLIHIELKNGRHTSYLDAFRQIQTYINEGHFKGIFSLVQMFVVSNGVQTKYIAANEVLNKEFLTSWTEESNPDVPVADLFAFAKQVLRIPQAHEMVTDYCQLDAKKRRLMLLRPYQIQAIQAMRQAYLQQISGYIWHATGSGKTLTSYKASRNLLLDMPSIDKTIFLIDRKDLDDKTCQDFNSYAEGDTVDVVGTETPVHWRASFLGRNGR